MQQSTDRQTDRQTDSDLLLILPPVPPVPRPFVYSLIRPALVPAPAALFAQWGISCVWAAGFRRPSPLRALRAPRTTALDGYTDRNAEGAAELGNTILGVHQDIFVNAAEYYIR